MKPSKMILVLVNWAVKNIVKKKRNNNIERGRWRRVSALFRMGFKSSDVLQVLLFFLIEKKEPFDTLLVQPTTRVHPHNNKAFNFIDLFFCFFLLRSHLQDGLPRHQRPLWPTGWMQVRIFDINILLLHRLEKKVRVFVVQVDWAGLGCATVVFLPLWGGNAHWNEA